MNELTKEDRIKTVFGGGGHVVILGAGASIASTTRNLTLGVVCDYVEPILNKIRIYTVQNSILKPLQHHALHSQ
jgi:hypothetical protein